jgi:hypothetical protein
MGKTIISDNRSVSGKKTNIRRPDWRPVAYFLTLTLVFGTLIVLGAALSDFVYGAIIVSLLALICLPSDERMARTK